MISGSASTQEPVSRGIIVNFKEEAVGWVHSYGTVEGFHGIRAQIWLLDETQVQFGKSCPVRSRAAKLVVGSSRSNDQIK
jgi:hypothetical protein